MGGSWEKRNTNQRGTLEFRQRRLERPGEGGLGSGDLSYFTESAINAAHAARVRVQEHTGT